MHIDPHTLSWTLAGAFLVTLQITVTVHILLHKDDVPSAIGWTGLVWLAPILGCIIYVLLGINRIRRKAIRLQRGHKHAVTLNSKTTAEIEQKIPPALRQLLRLGYKVHPQYMAADNHITPLCNGDEAYPRMCQAIAQAQHEVLIASYIFNNDTAGKMFLSALQQAVQNGAKVRLLVDGVGINYSRPNIARALKSVPQAELAVFLPSRHPVNLPFVNLRNHRKLMVIDGETAFFGGMNIAQGNLLSSKPKEPIQDVTFEIHGPVITQIQQLFLEDWLFTDKKSFLPYRPVTPLRHKTQGTTLARIIPDGPDADYGKIAQMCLGALACAQESVRIVTPYFLPENGILSALETAAMRGVEVEIILPQKSNIFGMDWAMRANFPRLLAAGVRLYQAKPPFDHSKLLLVDDTWLFAGSANWDVRSFKLNFESNMECFDTALAKQVLSIINGKKQLAVPVRTSRKVRWYHHLLFNTFRLLTPYY